MADDRSERARSEDPENGDDPREVLRQSVRQVRKSVLRTLVEELRQEVESLDAEARHGKSDAHTKHDMYLKFGSGVASPKSPRLK